MKTAIFRTISTEELLAKYEASLARKANEISHLQQVVELQDKIILIIYTFSYIDLSGEDTLLRFRVVLATASCCVLFERFASEDCGELSRHATPLPRSLRSQRSHARPL